MTCIILCSSNFLLYISSYGIVSQVFLVSWRAGFCSFSFLVYLIRNEKKLSNEFRKVVEGVGHLNGSLVRILKPQLLLDYHL